MALRIEVLGPLRVVGESEIEVSRSSHRRLLSILALDANRRVSTDRLIDRNWSDAAPPTARAVIQTHVSALRKLLPADVLVTDGPGYRLDLGRHALDADELAELAAVARTAVGAEDWKAALRATDAALVLCRGAPYEELRDDGFARPEIARLVGLHADLCECRAAALLALRREEEALADLERLVVEHPLRERLWEHLMTARYRVGRHADALAAYREAWAAFVEVGLKPSGKLRRLEQRILAHDDALASALDRHNLPIALTSFVGREEEMADITGLLDEHRLVTLTGVGGVGKTRIAREVAANRLDAFPHGCWLVELAPLRSREALVDEVASVLGVRPPAGDALEAMQSAIAADTLLVVLDNCEHVVDDAAVVALALLEAGPGIRVLVTSREPLRLPGEVVYVLPPLPIPLPDASTEGATNADATSLFRSRAALVRPSFPHEDGTSAAVTQICRRLDGIPLAIELAAGRIGMLSPDTIAEHLDDRFAILTGGSSAGPERHVTLAAALDWSYDLLEAPERLVLARLGVFRNGFTLAAARRVCSGDGIAGDDVVALVASLVDKSLVCTYDAETERYRLLETVREYARGRLTTTDEEATEQRHCAWAVEVAEDIVSRANAFDRYRWLDRLDAERENLDAALEWAESRTDDDAVVSLARALALNAWYAGRFARCTSHLEDVLSRPVPASTEAASRSFLSATRFFAGDGDAAFRESERAVALFEGLPASPDKAIPLGWHARLQLLLVERDPALAVSAGRAALAAAEACGDPAAEIHSRIALGRVQAWNGDVADGLRHHRLALELASSANDTATILDVVESMFDLCHLGPERRTAPIRLAADVPRLLSQGDDLRKGRWHLHFSLTYACLQSGRWDDARAAIDLFGRRRLEGWEKIGHLLTRSSLAWMSGRLDDARRDLRELLRLRPSRGWHADLYPLLAEIAADEGRLDDVGDAAETYLSLRVHATREADKLAVLSPLVRAEVDASEAADGDAGRRDHVERATSALELAEELLEAHPPRVPGSLRFETPATHLAIARAELSRATSPDPTLWEEVVSRADYVYSRVYGQARLAEALIAAGRADEGAEALRDAHDAADRIGASGVGARLDRLSARAALGARAGAIVARRRGTRRATRPVHQPGRR